MRWRLSASERSDYLPFTRERDSARSLREPRFFHRSRSAFEIFAIVWLVAIRTDPAAVLYAETPGPSAVPRNAAPGVAYVGSAACSGCHAALYESYRKTGMGRSMSASDPALQGRMSEPITIFQENIRRYFTVFRKGEDLYQSQYELDGSGKEVFRDVHRLEYAIGSGSNGQSYVVSRSGFLFQAPLSYYTKPGKWDLSPGFELGDAAFNRPIQAGCVACHSGRPNPVKVRPAAYGEPPFHELAIGCENCHGPGQLHVAERSKGLPVPKAGDTAIVNPARLPLWLADNICMNCHQAGEARVLQPGKDYSDFRPGTPLDQTLGIFRTPYRRESPPEEDLLQHYASMVLSRCYQASQGRMSCIGCHSPHTEPAPAEAAVYYRERCLTCHTDSSCPVPLPQRLERRPANDCAGCHMPKRKLKDIGHSALTNHRIPARPGEPLPETAFRETTTLPGVVQVNLVANQPKNSIPFLTQLQVYGELLSSHSEYQNSYLAVLDQLSKSQPDHPLVLSALARKSKLEATAEGSARAIQYLLKAVELGSTSIVDYQDLASLLATSQNSEETIRILKKGIELSPINGYFHKALALQYIGRKEYSKALESMRQHLALFPEDAFMRNLIQKAERSKPE